MKHAFHFKDIWHIYVKKFSGYIFVEVVQVTYFDVRINEYNWICEKGTITFQLFSIASNYICIYGFKELWYRITITIYVDCKDYWSISILSLTTRFVFNLMNFLTSTRNHRIKCIRYPLWILDFALKSEVEKGVFRKFFRGKYL